MSDLNRGLGPQQGVFPDETTLQGAKIKNSRVVMTIDGKVYSVDANDKGNGLLLSLGNYANPIKSFDPTTEMSIIRVLDAQSSLAVQEPSSTGIANAIDVSIGPAQNTVSDPVMISDTGVVTINVTGLYRFKFSAQIGRSGASGTSIVLLRQLVNGTQVGLTAAFTLSGSDDIGYIESENWVPLVAGTEVSTQCMRDIGGDNSGGVYAIVPTDEGAETWNTAPCVRLWVDQWVGA